MTSAACLPAAEVIPYTFSVRRRSLAPLTVLIDYADVPLALPETWCSDGRGYVRSVRGVFLHRHLLGLDRGDLRCVDHINRNPLDNRRRNLRIVTRGENMQNQGARKSLPRGVGRRFGRWIAYAHLPNKRVTIGYYDTLEDADLAARKFRAAHMPFSEEARDPTLRDARPPDKRARGKTSNFKGVHWHKDAAKWRAYGHVNRKLVHLGFFETEALAAAASAAWREANPQLKRKPGPKPQGGA